jgi:hypothetical protein
MYRTIVVGTDCSATATTAVMKTAELATLTGAKLVSRQRLSGFDEARP